MNSCVNTQTRGFQRNRRVSLSAAWRWSKATGNVSPVCNAAMKRVTAFAVLLVVLAAPVWGQDFNKGLAAYERGDYALYGLLSAL